MMNNYTCGCLHNGERTAVVLGTDKAVIVQTATREDGKTILLVSRRGLMRVVGRGIIKTVHAPSLEFLGLSYICDRVDMAADTCVYYPDEAGYVEVPIVLGEHVALEEPSVNEGEEAYKEHQYVH